MMDKPDPPENRRLTPYSIPHGGCAFTLIAAALALTLIGLLLA